MSSIRDSHESVVGFMYCPYYSQFSGTECCHYVGRVLKEVTVAFLFHLCLTAVSVQGFSVHPFIIIIRAFTFMYIIAYIMWENLNPDESKSRCVLSILLSSG